MDNQVMNRSYRIEIQYLLTWKIDLGVSTHYLDNAGRLVSSNKALLLLRWFGL